ncbi:MAG: hypothetical protein QW743_05955 [Candidatus Methanomethylicia archaeon]
MGKKYKKKLPLRPPKRIPKIFQCPNCGKKSIKIEINEEEGKAKITCGNCKINAEIMIPSIFTDVDVYGKFIDMYYSGELSKQMRG